MKADPLNGRKVIRYVLCGLSTRGIGNLAFPLTGKGKDAFSNDFSAFSQLTAVLDVDKNRVADFNRQAGLKLAHYLPQDFEWMIREQRPDMVLVAGTPTTHIASISTMKK